MLHNGTGAYDLGKYLLRVVGVVEFRAKRKCS